MKRTVFRCARLGLLLMMIGGSVAMAVGCTDESYAPASASSSGNKELCNGTANGRLTFTETTAKAGLGAFRHQRGQSAGKWLPETMGAGGAFVDYDGDDAPDVVLVSGRPWEGDAPPALRLYRNAGGSTFTDVTAEAGMNGTSAYGMGLTAADYDNDGDPDLYLTALEKNKLYRNEGNGTFREVSETAGVAGPAAHWSTAATFFDADRDGLLDLYVGGYVRWAPPLDLRCSLDGETESYCTPDQYEGLPGRFYHNEGNGTFANWTERAGLGAGPGKTLGSTTLDYNRDGWPDLFVANDGERNLLYENRGDGTFLERGTVSGIAFDENGKARAGMGVGASVVDTTGEATLFVGNFSTEMVGVYRHLGEGLFADRAALSQVGRSSLLTLTFGLLLFDADLDADLDLFLANGHIQEAVDKVQNGISYRQPSQLFLNNGEATFTELTLEASSPLAKPMVARGAAYADYDYDGDADVLLTENGGPAHLFRNDRRRETGADGPGGAASPLKEAASADEAAHFLRVTLRGRESNRDGVGARLIAWAGGQQIERRVQTGGSYLSQSELPLTLGLGRRAQVDSLRVEWPSGRVERFTGVPANQHVRLVEGTQTLAPLAASPEDSKPTASAH